MTRAERLVFWFVVTWFFVCSACTSAPACKPNPPEVIAGCIPADCESCGPSLIGRKGFE